LDLCSEQESIGVARAACFEILVASVRECVQTDTHAHDLLQYDGLFDTVGASLKAFPDPRLFFQWHINLPTYCFRRSRVWVKTRASGIDFRIKNDDFDYCLGLNRSKVA